MGVDRTLVRLQGLRGVHTRGLHEWNACNAARPDARMNEHCGDNHGRACPLPCGNPLNAGADRVPAHRGDERRHAQRCGGRPVLPGGLQHATAPGPGPQVQRLLLSPAHEPKLRRRGSGHLRQRRRGGRREGSGEGEGSLSSTNALSDDGAAIPRRKQSWLRHKH